MPSFAAIEPILVFTLLNITMTLGLYVTALSGQLSMATAAFAAVGGYCAGILAVNFDWPFIATVLVGAALSAALGGLLALMMVRMVDFILKLTTLAFGESLAVVAYNWDYIGGANSFSGIPLRTTVPVCAAAALVALYIAWSFDRSWLGFASRAVRDDPIAASATGISIRYVRVVTFVVGTTIVGAGGAIQAQYTLVVGPQDLSFFVSLNFIIYLLFGGLQTLWGGVLGATLLTVLPELLRFSDRYRLILFGLIIVLVVLWRPDGLLRRNPTGRPCRFFKWNFIAGRPARLPQGGVADRKLPSVLANAPQSRL